MMSIYAWLFSGLDINSQVWDRLILCNCNTMVNEVARFYCICLPISQVILFLSSACTGFRNCHYTQLGKELYTKQCITSWNDVETSTGTMDQWTSDYDKHCNRVKVSRFLCCKQRFQTDDAPWQIGIKIKIKTWWYFNLVINVRKDNWSDRTSLDQI